MEVLSAILVPVDYWEPSLNALDVALLLSHPHQTTVHLVSILDPDRPTSTGVDMADLSTERIVDSATEKIKELAARTAHKHQITCIGICRQGGMVDESIAAAHAFNADLVVMPTHIGSDARAFRLSSEAYNVLKSAPCPVLTVPDQQAWTAFKQILLPIRPVAGALDKYEFARMISQKNDAQLTILALAAPDEVISIHQLQDELSILKTKLAQDGVRSTMLYYPTDLIAETVLEKANELSADLLIITASLATTSTNFFIGSFSQQIIHNAPIPVLSVRPDGAKEQTASSTFWKYGLNDPGLTVIGF